MNGKSKVWAAALLLAVLVLGGALGATTVRLVDRGPEERETAERPRRDRDGYLDRLTEELELTAEQRAEMELIVDRHRERMAELWREVRPRFEETKRDFREEVNATLNEEQRFRFEEMMEEHSKRRHGDNKVMK